ncbi:glycosyltransferase family 2 protein, partial [Candidatus Azambacteria bacterium]|nr:glycosyltransferase family 2 protein [Candidatus Azambacteria bacterium]
MVKVSVVIPTHNRPQLLQRAIASVLAQTFQDVEIIVVDDGKEKSAEHIVHGFHDLRIVYCADKKEQGGAAARNVGIVRAKGDFIAFLDDDDEWLENKLQIQMSSFEKTPQDVGFCFSAVINAYDDKEEATEVNGGIKNYFEIALTRFKGFLT